MPSLDSFRLEVWRYGATLVGILAGLFFGVKPMNCRDRSAALAFRFGFLAGICLIFFPTANAFSQSSQRVTVSGFYAAAFEPVPTMLCPDLSRGVMLFPNDEFRERYERIKEALEWEPTRAFGPTVFFRIRGVHEPADESTRFFGAEAIVTVTATEEMFSVENVISGSSSSDRSLSKFCKE